MSYTLPPWSISKTPDGIYVANVRGIHIIGHPAQPEGEAEDDAKVIVNAPTLLLQTIALITAIQSLADEAFPLAGAVDSLGLQAGVVRKTIEQSAGPLNWGRNWMFAPRTNRLRRLE